MSVPELGSTAWALTTLSTLSVSLCDSGAERAELVATGAGAARLATLYPFELTEWVAGAQRLQRTADAQHWLTERYPLVAATLLGYLPSGIARPVGQQLSAASQNLGLNDPPVPATEQTVDLLLTCGLVHALTLQPFDFGGGVNFIYTDQGSAMRTENLQLAAAAFAGEVEELLPVVKAL